MIEEEDDLGSEEEFDEEFDTIIRNINITEIKESFDLPETFDIETILKELISEPVITSEQRNINEIVNGVL